LAADSSLPTALLYRRLVEDGRGLICAHDRTGRLLFINPAAALALGYPGEELAGTNLRDLLHPGVRHLFGAYLERIWKKGHDQGLMRLVHRGGRTLFWSYDNAVCRGAGLPELVLGHAQDVTEEQMTQWSMRRQDERYRTLVDDTTQGIGRIDFERNPSVDSGANQVLEEARQHGYVGECNRAFAQMYGASSVEEMIGVRVRNFALFNAPENLPGLRTFFANDFGSTDLESREVDARGQARRFLLNLIGVVEERMLRCIWCLQRELSPDAADPA
jgi:PAS domain S-box-containing protein